MESRTNVEFECRVAIGLGGVAVLDLVEKCSPNWTTDGQELNCVKEDILMDGAGEWLQHTMGNLPGAYGVYKVVGKGVSLPRGGIEHLTFKLKRKIKKGD